MLRVTVGNYIGRVVSLPSHRFHLEAAAGPTAIAPPELVVARAHAQGLWIRVDTLIGHGANDQAPGRG